MSDADAATGPVANAHPAPPTMPSGAIVLEPPPPLPDQSAAGGWLLNAFPMVGALASVAMVLTMGGGDRTRMFMIGAMVLATSVGFLVVQAERGRRQRAESEDDARTDFLHYLDELRTQVHQIAADQRAALMWHFPSPSAALVSATEYERVGERGPEHPHLHQLRFGTTDWPLTVDLRPPAGSPVERTDPVTASAVHRFLSVHRTQPDLPALWDLAAFRRTQWCGPREQMLAAVRALICSGALAHRPDRLQFAVLCAADRKGDWDWFKWLPHGRSSRQADGAGGARLVLCTGADLSELVEFSAAPDKRVVVVLDGVAVTAADPWVRHASLVEVLDHWGDLHEPEWMRVVAEETSDGAAAPSARIVALGHPEAVVRLDAADTEVAAAISRRLWPLTGAAAHVSAPNLGALLGIGKLAEAKATPQPPTAADLLRVPIGIDPQQQPVWLDLKESAFQGMGPHGLVVGATGSGKSEFLRTLVLGLALTHPSDLLNLVLVDFKGGATFAGLSQLPHCSAVITNLADELDLVQRMEDALGGELVRRQEVLRAAGNYASRHDLERARTAGSQVPELPLLLVVVDEFSELLAARPEFADLFVAIGRLGRSLGVHLLLASQRLDEGRLRGLESHLSYRVGLRTFSAAESRAVLGVPDAHELPNQPGLGFLRSDPTTLVRFTGAYVSGPAASDPTAGSDAAPPPHQRARLLTLEPVPFPERTEPPSTPSPDEHTPSELMLAVRRVRGPAAHRIWLPPLNTPDTVGNLAGPLQTSPRGLHRADLKHPLRVNLGTVDRPRQQSRDPLTVDLDGGGGNVAVIGSPRSGKSTALQSLLVALSLTHTPRQAQFLVLDFGGGGFTALVEHPHVMAVATRAEPEVVRRIVAQATGLLRSRETWFRAHGISSIEDYRQRQRTAPPDWEGDGYGEVFVVVDGWSTLRSDFEDLEEQLQALATAGLGFGIHLATATNRWTDLRAALRDQLGTRIELKLGDAMDSEVDRRTAASVPAGRPGRGITAAGGHCLIALPRLDNNPDPDTLSSALTDAARQSSAAWNGPPGPRLRLLPSLVYSHDLVAANPQCAGLLLGIDEGDLAPVELNLSAHLQVFGDSGSGRTALLRTLAAEIMRTRSPAQAQIVVLDPRRTLLGEVPQAWLADYLSDPTAAAAVISDVARQLGQRRPGAEVTPEQLRARSWWHGPEVYVLVDDLDLCAVSAGSPLAALVPLLPQAADVGLHLVVARRSGGASRAFYEPVLQTLRDLNTPGVLLSGSPLEGALVGTTKARPGVPGRALYVERDEVRTVQVAWVPPAS